MSTLLDNRLRDTARTAPGRLMQSGLGQMQKALAHRGVDLQNGQTVMRAQVLTYLNTIFHARHSPYQVGPRNCQEMKTLAEALDSLVCGDLGHVGDVLMQRLKALEQAQEDGHWMLAKELELVQLKSGLTTDEERAEAIKGRLREYKLAQAGVRPPGPGGRGGYP